MFANFDDEGVFQQLNDWASSIEGKNFVLDFDPDSATCATDLNQDRMRDVLASRDARHKCKPEVLGARWINIWIPEKQKDILKCIAEHYGFSPRLLLSMCSDPLRPVFIADHETRRGRVEAFMHPLRNRKDRKEAEVRVSRPTDEESHGSAESPGDSLDLNHYRVVNDIWHYSSLDWGYKYLCVGYNSVFRNEQAIDPGSDKPPGKRVWTWLVLCNDGTVISIHENPFPSHKGPLRNDQVSVLLSARRNVRNVFKQLSKAFDPGDLRTPLETVKVRFMHKRAINSESPKPFRLDASSLLFYYLFDDWHTSYSLVARRENQYGMQLDHLRSDMLQKAELEHIERLHHYGRQLAALKRIYQSYDAIIERILEGSHVGTISLSAGNAKRQLDSMTTTSAFGAPISTVAVVRFQRLRDRIRMYALSEIQDCLDEKEALVFLNFNLITLRESSYVERLTRITILLAKATILFIPVSIMSAYFTVPLSTSNGGVVAYSLSTYWVTFAVVFIVSILGLILFGRLSGTQEGRMIYRSFTKAGCDAWRRVFVKKRTTEKSG